MCAADDDKARSTSSSMRFAFPNALERPELRTPYAWFRRHLLLFILYFLWICGVGSITTMWIFSAFCVARTIVTYGAEPLPWQAVAYLLAMVLYYSFHHLVYHSKPQGEWRSLRAFSRQSMVQFPYFRNVICIFDGREDESIQHPLMSMVPVKDKSLFAYHPHGVLSTGMAYNGVHAKRFEESDTRWLVAENLFWFPLLRDVLHWLNFDDVNKQTFVRHMKQSRNIALIPGGFEEATIYERGKHRVFIKKRFGFIKLALRFGYKVHPTYTFGEEETFHALPYFLKQRMLLNKWKVPTVVFFGRFLCFFMPLQDVELTTVVGKPIQMPTIAHPTKEDIAKHHKIYIDALTDVFERYKHKYAKDPTATLEIF